MKASQLLLKRILHIHKVRFIYLLIRTYHFFSIIINIPAVYLPQNILEIFKGRWCSTWSKSVLYPLLQDILKWIWWLRQWPGINFGEMGNPSPISVTCEKNEWARQFISYEISRIILLYLGMLSSVGITLSGLRDDAKHVLVRSRSLVTGVCDMALTPDPAIYDKINFNNRKCTMQ